MPPASPVACYHAASRRQQRQPSRTTTPPRLQQRRLPHATMLPPAPAGDPGEGPRGDQCRHCGRSSRGAPPPAMEAAPRGAHPSAMGPAWAELTGRRGLQLRRWPRHRCGR
jgi:hypothetical protein